ncbi:MAG TPA: MBL fold metallo-hydrolase [Terriglobia bacterium]|nr:MBL fold metallo-hydrolase [Terriglobia bacterium]
MTRSENQWKIDIILQGSPTQAAVTLLRKHDLLVLVDSGWPRTRAQLVTALAEQGVQPHEITHVLHTHLHIDHAANHPILTEAVLLASRTEFVWADWLYRNLIEDEDDVRFILSVFPELSGPALEQAVVFIKVARRICRNDLFSRWNEIRFYEDQALPEGLSLMPLPGHTPGHCGIVVSNIEPVLIVGDALTTEHTCLSRMPPTDPNDFKASIERVRSFRGRIVPGHLPPFEQRLGGGRGEWG